ncbi:MAG: thioredoxin-disulfide reductase [Clostridia bacterium]
MLDILIIGGGPAGLTAGIYASRGGAKCAILESNAIGGQASVTPDIENYPGIDSISGFDLTYKMMKQCEHFGVEFIFSNFSKIDLISEIKTVTLADGKIVEAKSVIIATGASARKLQVENEDKFLGRGISYCATCDGAFFRGKTVAVVGGGNTAVEDALYLSSLAKTVYLIHRRNELRATEILSKRIAESDVKIVWDSVVTKLDGNTKLTEVTLNNVKTNTSTPLLVDGLFVAVGQKPMSLGFDGLALTPDGYAITDENMASNLSGVFVAGDIRQKALRQIVTAAADGAIAANSALSFVDKH